MECRGRRLGDGQGFYDDIISALLVVARTACSYVSRYT